MTNQLSFLTAAVMIAAASCGAPAPPETSDSNRPPEPGSFASDLQFLRQHTEVLILSDSSRSAMVAVTPDLQGRAMTSTTGGDDGLSLGWINRDLIASGDTLEHMNPYGGEDRFWLGPEGGQYSIFFKGGDPFDLDHWHTPAAFDTEPFEVVSSGSNEVQLRKSMQLENYSGSRFDVEVERAVRLLDRTSVENRLGLSLDTTVEVVAFESDNLIRNAGVEAWKPESGLLSIWILGMFNPSPSTTAVLPFHPGPEGDLGPVVNDEYFGKVPSERLVVRDSVLFFSGDGTYRSKIGLSPLRAKPVVGSFDAENEVLTIVQYTKPDGGTGYVNSMWEIQDDPYGGDVVNSYNDGPPEPGAAPLGPFYELETSSPAAELEPGEELRHVHRTFHFQGPRDALTRIAHETLGVGLDDIERALP